MCHQKFELSTPESGLPSLFTITCLGIRNLGTRQLIENSELVGKSTTIPATTL
jgi:hypothetical protein